MGVQEQQLCATLLFDLSQKLGSRHKIQLILITGLVENLRANR